ncbi:MAG: GtrA family protein [Candidatus Electrothrix sp. AUS4]|nr:GtrA family protein [Candidatus Electrothrix sp. AUS4]
MLNTAVVDRFAYHFTQLARYGIVALAALGFDYFILVLLTEYWHVNHLYSATAGFTIGLLVNYSLAVKFVFRESKLDDKKSEFLIYSIIGVFGLLFTLALMWLLTDVLSIHYTISKAAAVVLVFLFNFYARKTILFKD